MRGQHPLQRPLLLPTTSRARFNTASVAFRPRSPLGIEIREHQRKISQFGTLLIIGVVLLHGTGGKSTYLFVTFDLAIRDIILGTHCRRGYSGVKSMPRHDNCCLKQVK